MQKNLVKDLSRELSILRPKAEGRLKVEAGKTN
jgi:hypothetical protein